MQPTPELLTAADVAARLSVRPSTIVEWRKTGRIPSVRISHKVIRFNMAEVLNALTCRPALKLHETEGGES